jgi:hypothetical protein
MHMYIDASEWRCTMLTQKTDIALDSLQQPNLSPLHHMYGTASLIFTGNSHSHSQSHVITTTLAIAIFKDVAVHAINPSGMRACSYHAYSRKGFATDTQTRRVWYLKVTL